MASYDVHGISPFFQELAKKSVNENPNHIEAHLNSLKRWIKSCPHLQIADNDDFLLSFLRYAHYDHSVAQKRLDNYCSMKCSPKHGLFHWFDFPTLSDPVVDKYLDMGLCVPCGTIESGVFMILLRLGAWSPDIIPALAMRIMLTMNFEMFLLDQSKQIGGIGLIVDMSCISSKQAHEWNSRKSAKLSFKLLQEASPIRAKHLVFYRESKLFDIAFKLIELWMSEKMRSRVFRVKDDMVKAFTRLPGLVDVMPAEYGGKNGTLEQLIDNARKQFKEFYAKGSPLAGTNVYEDLRPAHAISYIREYQDDDLSSLGYHD